MRCLCKGMVAQQRTDHLSSVAIEGSKIERNDLPLETKPPPKEADLSLFKMCVLMVPYAMVPEPTAPLETNGETAQGPHLRGCAHHWRSDAKGKGWERGGTGRQAI